MGLCVCSQKTAAFWGNDTRFSVLKKKKRSRALRPSKKILWRLLYLSLKDLIICHPNGCSSKLFGDFGCGAKCAVMGSWQDCIGHSGRVLPATVPAMENLYRGSISNQRWQPSERGGRQREQEGEGASFPQMVQRTWEA